MFGGGNGVWPGGGLEGVVLTFCCYALTGIFLAFVIWYRHVMTQFLVCICS